MIHEHERLDRLEREKIDIIQSKDVFSFSLDAVLLADFVVLPKRENVRIIDACSGNGAVAFMLSYKSASKIDAIEYQLQLSDMAQRTITLNQLEDKVRMIHGDYKQANQWFDNNTIDVITCNPPYFKVQETSMKNKKEAYTLARHEVAITLEEWVLQSAKLLKVGGKLYCVHRPDRLLDILTTLQQYQLVPKQIRYVHPKKDALANMVLIEAVKKGKTDGLKILPSIIVYDENGQYTPEVERALYGE